MSDLSRELAVSLSAMTQIADRLERAKLVRRVSTANDRRIRRLQLTDRGKRVMQLHETARIDRVLAVFELLTPKTRKEALATLETLLRASMAAREQDGHPHRRSSRIPAIKVIG
jgi:DNA-binding MarR family transcriptional regulator